MLNDQMGYVKVDRFGRTTYDEFSDALHQLSADGASTFVIDLRDNGGGYMNAATQMLDLFFEKGQLLVYTEGKARPRENSYAQIRAKYPNQRVVVLINEGSASASEIFAGAIQDHDRGIVVGRRSFGKGLVQEQTMWPNGAATRLTIARYFTPSGRCIQKPYDDGEEAYNEDYYHRYESGELISQDSIEITDSSEYYTDNGRKVYGSGGIIPDVFVPIDTTQGSYLLNQLVYRGIIYDYAFDYTDEHRSELSEFENVWTFIDGFEVSEAMFDGLLELGKSEGVIVSDSDLTRSKQLINKRIKAYIGRNMWQDEGFYPIWNLDDPTIEAAMIAKDDILN
jgi:carboxyl-terminal processing protease